MSIQVLVGCADLLLTEAVRAALGTARRTGPEFRQLTARAPDLAARLAQAPPDVLLLEHGVPGLDFVRVHEKLVQLGLRTRTLVVMRAADSAVQLQLLREGASGCLLASDIGAVAAKAIRAVHGGQLWFSRTVMHQAMHHLVWRASPRIAYLPVDEEGLTPRESEILRLIGSGLTNKEIARRLEISDHTVKTHLHHVYVKLHRSGRYKAFLAHAASPPGLESRPDAAGGG